MDAYSFLYWCGLLLPVVVAIGGGKRILGGRSLKIYFFALFLFFFLECLNGLISVILYEDAFGGFRRYFSYAGFDGFLVLLIHRIYMALHGDYLQNVGRFLPSLAFTGFCAAIMTEYAGCRLGIFEYKETWFNPYIFHRVSLHPVLSVTMVVPAVFYLLARIKGRLA